MAQEGRGAGPYIALVAVFFFCAAAAPSFVEPAGFKGLRWGMSVEEAVKAVIEQTPGPISGPRDSRVYGGFEIRYDDWVATAETQVTVELPAGKLAAVSIRFNPRDFQVVKEVFVRRYGKPTLAAIRQLQNAMGAKISSEELTWKGPRIRISLVEHADLSTSVATLGQTADIERRAREREKAIADAVRGL
jgi:hypothetical protein